MNWLLPLPARCLVCGTPHAQGPVCRSCEARYQKSSWGDGGSGPCQICGQPCLAEARLCVDCGAQSWSFPSIDGWMGYQDPAAELLRQYKFGGLTSLAKGWLAPMASRLVPSGPLIPVPPLKSHLRARGWDPVAIFARQLGAEAGLPVWNVLHRQPSLSQKDLRREARLQNAQRAYGLRRGKRSLLSGLPLAWLIDDVVTTGATVEACAKALRDAGVGQVRILCLGLH